MFELCEKSSGKGRGKRQSNQNTKMWCAEGTLFDLIVKEAVSLFSRIFLFLNLKNVHFCGFSSAKLKKNFSF